MTETGKYIIKKRMDMKIQMETKISDHILCSDIDNGIMTILN